MHRREETTSILSIQHIKNEASMNWHHCKNSIWIYIGIHGMHCTSKSTLFSKRMLLFNFLTENTKEFEFKLSFYFLFTQKARQWWQWMHFKNALWNWSTQTKWSTQKHGYWTTSNGFHVRFRDFFWTNLFSLDKHLDNVQTQVKPV